MSIPDNIVPEMFVHDFAVGERTEHREDSFIDAVPPTRSRVLES